MNICLCCRKDEGDSTFSWWTRQRILFVYNVLCCCWYWSLQKLLSKEGKQFFRVSCHPFKKKFLTAYISTLISSYTPDCEEIVGKKQTLSHIPTIVLTSSKIQTTCQNAFNFFSLRPGTELKVLKVPYRQLFLDICIITWNLHRI